MTVSWNRNSSTMSPDARRDALGGPNKEAGFCPVVKGGSKWRAAFSGALFLMVFAFAGSVSAAPAIRTEGAVARSDDQGRDRPKRLIVKYRSHGDAALDECADRLSSRGTRFAESTRDGSESLDQVHRQYGLGRHHALFRRPGGSDLASERRRLRDRYQTRITRRASAQRRSARAPRVPTDLSHIYRVAVPAGVRVEDAVAALQADPHVEYAQADYAMELDQASSFDDPFLTSSGAWGQPYADLWGLDQIKADAAWDLTLGEGIVVAVVDTGLDRFHPDIAENVWVNPGEDLNGDGLATAEDINGVDDDGNGFIDDLTGFDFADSVDADEDSFYDDPEDVSDADPFDVNGHGTHVAGTIAAVAGNGIGIAGVAPRARIMALRGFPEGQPGVASTLWRAVLYAAENGASVVNNSWSCSGSCPENPLADDVLRLVDALDTVVVTSAGNASDDVLFRSPENGPRVVTVGAVGYTELPASFTNIGWGIDIMAPGGGPAQAPSVRAANRNILSLMTSALDPEEEPFTVAPGYWRLAGTSMSSPHVAGAVALLRNLRPELTPSQVRRLIRTSGRDAGLPGHDPTYGAGLLDLPALLTAPLPDLELGFDSPALTSLHDPADGPVLMTGRASGRDLESFEVSVASGISGRSFEAIDGYEPTDADFSDKLAAQPVSRIDRNFSTDPPTTEPPTTDPSRVLALWDIRDVPDGPYVMRLRAQLTNGQVVDEFLSFSVERNTPIRISEGELNMGEPDLSGRRVAWPIAESETPRSGFDLALGRLSRQRDSSSHKSDDSGSDRDRPKSELAQLTEEPPDRSQMHVLFEREGSQGDVAIAGRLLAWRSHNEGAATLEWCRLEAGSSCVPQSIDTSDGLVAAPFVANGWIAWHRDFGNTRVVEGCRVTRANPVCEPAPLLDDDLNRNWSLRSFDGKNLLVETPGIHAFCPLPRTGGGSCRPEPIEFAAGTPRVFEPIHDGQLLVFMDVTIESRPPPGCLPGEFVVGCFPVPAVVVTYRACWVDEATSLCDSVPALEPDRIDYFAGLEVSGRRIAWSKRNATEDASVQFCEFDPVSLECDVQRLTGASAREDGVAIEGNRIVWRDLRTGNRAIWGTELLEIVGPEKVDKRAGWNFSIPLRVKKGAARKISYSVEPFSGLDPALAKARIDDPGPPGGAAKLVGRLPEGSVGTHQWRIRAEGEGGLFSEQIIELNVAPPASDVGRK